MQNVPPEFRDVMSRLSAVVNSDEFDWEFRRWCLEMHESLESGIERFQEQLSQAEMQGARNPAYSGDYVGYLSDDFD